VAPPLLAKRDEKTGQLQTREYGPWMVRGFKLLAKLRGLRGTPFDVFGYTAERRMERALIGEYEQLVEQVRAAESRVRPGSTKLTGAAALSYYKLMAYKDEYEVARLYTSGDFERRVKEQFDGNYELHFHLAPPLLAKRDEKTGQLQKREYGPWMVRGFKLLAKLRGLRGTAFDVFGYTAERRMERALIGEYEQLVERVLVGLSEANFDTAVLLLSLPEKIRGFGHVKEKNLEDVRKEQAALLEKFSSPQASARAAA